MQQVLYDNSFSTDQVNKLQELIDEMSINAFDETSDDADEFRAFLLTWASSALNLFTKNELIMITTTTGDYLKQNPDSTATNSDNPPAGYGGHSTIDCDCSGLSDMCWGGTMCNGDCGFATSVGCGLFWIFNCEYSCI